jgi:hypothetical protein
VKQKNSSKVLLLFTSVCCIGLIIFAGIKSSSYHAPSRPTITQQSLQKQIAKTQPTTVTPKGAITKKTPIVKKSTEVPSLPSTLIDTGPKDVVAVFLLASTTGYFVFLKRLQSHENA